MRYDFKNLIVLDMANNHQGDLNHGFKIINELAVATKGFNFNFCIKFQFRQLETFIHKDFKSRTDIPHIPRFVETELSLECYKKLVEEAKAHGFVTACTPFDEDSVSIIEEMGIEIIKIASCSANDYPLMERVKSSKLPVLASTGGLSAFEIDSLVELFEHRETGFAIHHCVSIYPTPVVNYNLNQIKQLKNRYPDLEIGWSTHEDPEDMSAVMMASACGATMLERHVGVETKKYKLNKYSSTPSQVKKWVESFERANSALGGKNRAPSSEIEKNALNSLQRGVYTNKEIKNGQRILRSDVYFAMPAQDGQLTAGKFCENLILKTQVPAHGVVLSSAVYDKEPNKKSISVPVILLTLKSMLREAKIRLSRNTEIEISHHYGIEHFREFGAILITIVNGEYCKKLVVQFPRQKHPYHYHKIKQETFQVLSGDLSLEIDGHPHRLEEGEIKTVMPNSWHKFDTLDGVIFEEISTKSTLGDSYYEDEKIMLNINRKTNVKLS